MLINIMQYTNIHIINRSLMVNLRINYQLHTIL